MLTAFLGKLADIARRHLTYLAHLHYNRTRRLQKQGTSKASTSCYGEHTTTSL